MRTTVKAFGHSQDGHNRGLGPAIIGTITIVLWHIADTIATIHTERRADTPGHTLPAGLCGRPVAADRIEAIAARRCIGHHRTAAARWNTLTLRRRILHPTLSERHADPTAVLDDRNQALGTFRSKRITHGFPLGWTAMIDTLGDTIITGWTRGCGAGVAPLMGRTLNVGSTLYL